MSFSPTNETKELNNLTRQEADGAFVQLSEGVTHYELSNPESEKTIVLVHGFSTPYFIYDPTFEFLTKSGFRVLRYDLFGRGFSDRPSARYNIDLFVRQLTDLLDALRISWPVDLIGLSMGGPIAATFTARHPERVNKLILIDPAGARRIWLSLITRVLTAPIVGETIFSLLKSGRFIENISGDFVDRQLVEKFRDRYLAQMQFKGFRRAILSTLRNNMLGSFLDSYKRVGKMEKPVLLFWGRDDNTIPIKYSKPLRKAIPAAVFHVIENCGHLPHYEKPDEFTPILLAFLSRS